MSQYNSLHCCLCLEELSASTRPVQEVLEKGLNTTKKISPERNLEELLGYLQGIAISVESITVHKDYRRKFADARRSSLIPSEAKRLRSQARNLFEWRKCCFFCDSTVDFKHKDQARRDRGGLAHPPPHFCCVMFYVMLFVSRLHF